MKKYNVAVVGVGAVGEEMVKTLLQRKFPVNELKVLARSARPVNIAGQTFQVRETLPEEFKGIDIALFAGTEGDKGAAVTFGPEAVKRGAVVIDNGADFRMDPKVPLVVPEVNAGDVKKHQGIIANPNCSTIQMVVALWPIHQKSRIKRVIVSTYQAASGAGRKAMEELYNQTAKFIEKGEITPPSAFSHRIAFNLIPQIGSFQDLDYTTEEWKMVKETHKIMHDDKIKVTATTIRVPVLNAHSESIYVETEKTIPVEEAREIFRKAPGITFVDEPAKSASDPKLRTYPMPIDADQKDDVYIGRVREDPFVKNGLSFWCVADNLRKGAALNAVQIAELL